MEKAGKIIIPDGANIWAHEMSTAKVLAHRGHTVEFVLVSDRDFTKSPDVLIDGVHWEMKSPRTDKIQQLEKNLKRANRQAAYIIIDSQRMNRLQDKVIQRFLVGQLQNQRSIKGLLFIDRKRSVIDIRELL